eukprot:TRINITY_DN1484_c0_g1_i2.p1 TRINITY_DN1484_c0_g1~~TRINITY_DN1484_c0_g1_i2.p1  ORF type:complete len:2057 (-),score=813.75 TRINITY_DN1484_c0_g1_i2:105-6251(-)
MRRRGEPQEDEQVSADTKYSMKISLSDADQAAQSHSSSSQSQPALSPLSDQEIQEVLRRAPKLQDDEANQDKDDFFQRESSLKRPKTEENVKHSFPSNLDLAVPEPKSAETKDSPLRVVRYLPEGEIKFEVPHISITFSQPMIELSSVQQSKISGNAGIELAPEIEGEWKWLGTQCLKFEPKKRFNNSTKYTVKVSKGTKSALGAELQEQLEFSFTTPLAKLTSHYPRDRQTTGLRPSIFLEFDQAVDKNSVLENVLVRSKDNTEVKLVLSTAEAALADEELAKYIKRNKIDVERPNYVFLGLSQDLPSDSELQVTTTAGIKATEGPLPSQHSSNFSFQTYGEFKLVKAEPERPNPGSSFSFEFSNEIDSEHFYDLYDEDSSVVSIQPELKNKQVEVSWKSLVIRGMSQPKTNYTVTVKAGFKDKFGQVLAKPVAEQFNVGAAPPMFISLCDGVKIVDPTSAIPTYSVLSSGYEKLRVSLYQVEPEKDFDNSEWGRSYDYEKRRSSNSDDWVGVGNKIVDQEVSVEGDIDALVETRIDLTPALQFPSERFGQVVIQVLPVKKEEKKQEDQDTYHHDRERASAWCQVTQLGLATLSTTRGKPSTFWLSNLSSGKPVEGATVSVVTKSDEGEQKSESAVSDATGVSKFLVTSENDTKMLVVRKGNDICFQDHLNFSYGGRSENLVWHIFDDRQLYKPKETARVKGYIRVNKTKEDGFRELELPAAGSQVSWKFVDARWSDVSEGTTETNEFGAFDIEVSIPDNINLGGCNINFSFGDESFGHQIQVQEFRKPEFKVSASTNEGPIVTDSFAVASVSASYYSGGPLCGIETNWQVSSSVSQYSPPGWSDYIFGKEQPWFCWWIRRVDQDAPKPVSFTSKTDPTGVNRIRVAIDGRLDTPAPITVSAEATVLDVNRQARSSTTSFIVHPSEYYVGVKSEKAFVKPADKLEFDLVVSGIEGKLVGNVPVKVQVHRKVYETKRGNTVEKSNLVKEETVVSSADGPAKYVFTSEAENSGGEYEVSVTVEDAKARVNSSFKTFWVSGGASVSSATSDTRISSQNVGLIPDKQTYQPNEVAKVLIQPPFVPCNAIASFWCGDAIIWTKSISISKEEQTHTLEIAITDQHIPNMKLKVDVVGNTPRFDDKTNKPSDSLPPKPAYGSGDLDIKVPFISKKLKVELSPRDPICRPGEETLVEAVVYDSAGKPVDKSEVTLFVVDDAVLSLAGYSLVDPINAFYQERYGGFQTSNNRDSISIQDWNTIQSIIESKVREAEERDRNHMMLETCTRAYACYGAPMAMRDCMLEKCCDSLGGGEGGSEGPEIAVRTNFDSLAVFEAHLVTDSNGKCKLPFKLPDNLTSYRVWAVAVHSSTHYGIGESSITAKLPLMMRPSLPRFLNFGDVSKLPVVLQNQSPNDLQVKVAARALRATLSQGKAGYSLTLRAGERAEILFETETSLTGTSQFQFVCIGKSGANSTGEYTDAALVKVPVFTPATSEAFATYGELDGENVVVTQPVRAPEDVFAQFGSLDVTLSSTAVGALTDTFVRLVQCRFESTEGRASRVLSILALQDVVDAFKCKEVPSLSELVAIVEKDLEKISQARKSSGGFGFWSADETNREFAFVSVHAIHAILAAKAKKLGERWTNQLESDAVSYLKNVSQHIDPDYSSETKCTIRCYAAHVLAKYNNKTNNELAEEICKEFGGAGSANFSLESLAWLLTSFAPEHELAQLIVRRMDNSVQESAETANFISGYGDSSKLSYALLFSSHRTDAVCLDALIHAKPQDPIIPKIVKGLLAHRKRGTWASSQENVFALLALSRYFALYEKDTPDCVSNTWIGNAHAGQLTFKGRSTDKHTVVIAMKHVIQLQSEGDNSAKNLTIQKQGAGRLYYRLGLEYAPKNLDTKNLDRGFSIERSFVGVDAPTDVAWDAAKNEWRVKSGARVKVVLQVINTQRRYHVALVDKLPAGFEALNPALSGTQSIPTQESKFGGWFGRWFEHENYRDERVECFSSLVWEGDHQYAYYARATTPGTFIVPPVKAEEMYSPEVFGRSASTRVVVE